MSDLTLITCGAPRDHKCDSDGPEVFFLSDGTTTFDKSKSGKGCTGGSVTCSVCGMSKMELSMWQDW